MEEREEPRPVEDTAVTRNVEQERPAKESGPCGLPKGCVVL